jgi:hypothetical protein
MSALLFLDVDGVLNDHIRFPNGYCGTDPACVGHLNHILKTAPDAKVVISSSWRYLLHSGSMTLAGLENLLLTHGLDIYGRLHGVTERDAEFPPDAAQETYDRLGLIYRAHQIDAYLREHRPQRWCVLDDLPVPVPQLVQTDGAKGLEERHVEAALEWLL